MKIKLFLKKSARQEKTINKKMVSFDALSKEQQEKIIRNGAKDFAIRFENVMRELSNG